MKGKRESNEDNLPEFEFSIFSAALSLLTKLGSNKHEDYQDALTKLINLYPADKDQISDRNDVIKKNIDVFINKIKRKISRGYGEEGFDLRVISTCLNDALEQKKYLLRDVTFQYHKAQQLINIVTRVINHFHLTELANIFKKHYFDQVDFIPVVKYLDPEHKADQINLPVTRYASLLTIMNSMGVNSEQNTLRPNRNMFVTASGFRLIPKNKLNPRLPLSLKETDERTPQGVKYHIGEKEYLIDMSEIVGTETLLKIKKNTHANKTPGPLCLGPFPVVSSYNPSAQTLADLIIDLRVVSVLTIEEKFIAENTHDGEKKALPSDWLQQGVTVGLIQCPDLHAMRIFHTLLAAQYLFSEALTLLPPIKDQKYINLINELMSKHFLESDKDVNIKAKTTLPNLFQPITDRICKNDNEEAVYLEEVTTRLKWNNHHEKQASVQNNHGRVLVHCKAGMSRSATALLSMYIVFIDVILQWHANDFIQDEKDQVFGAIVKAIFHPSQKPKQDVKNIVHIFSENYRPITPIKDQIVAMAQLIQFKRKMLREEAAILDNMVFSQEIVHQTSSQLTNTLGQ